MSLRLLLSFLLLSTLANCSEDPQKPKNLIDEDTYIDLLVELQLIRSYGENAKTDSITIDSLTTAAFEKYNVSAESFMESHQYYEYFPDQQKVRTEEAIERLKIDKTENSDTTEIPTAPDQ